MITMQQLIKYIQLKVEDDGITNKRNYNQTKEMGKPTPDKPESVER